MQKIKAEQLRSLGKWAIYILLLVLCCALQTMPGFMELFGIKPVLLLPLAVCFSMYEGVMPSAFYSMAAGLLWDITSGKLFGFNGLIFLCAGTMISLLCIYYLRTRIWNAIAFSSALLLVQGSLNYLFYYAIWGHADSGMMYWGKILPTGIYTVLITPLAFLLVRLIENKLNRTVRI